MNRKIGAVLVSSSDLVPYYLLYSLVNILHCIYDLPYLAICFIC